jgi:hypothetical protein
MTPNQKHIQAILNLATAAEVAHGKAWYSTANDTAAQLSLRYHISPVTACGVIAALSPRNKWSRNVIDAENVIAAFVAGGEEAAAEVKCCTFGANKAKALAILANDLIDDDAILAVLSGPKLSEFFNCIRGITDVCIDGHAYSIWFGDRITLAKVPSIGKKIRQVIKKDYLAVAEANGLKGYEVQAITWVAHRRIHGVG